MLASNGKLSVLSSKDYIFEPKMDGIRCILVKRGRKVYMFSRTRKDLSFIFPIIKKKFEDNYRDNFILDGEIVCYNERGLPDYRLLMRREQASTKHEIDLRANAIPATYVAFDILELNGNPLISEKLVERKKALMNLIKENNHVERILFTEQGEELWDLIKKNNLEGVVAKLKNSYYLPGQRTTDWLKLKNGKSIDVVIMGYIPTRGNPNSFTSLIIGLYKNNSLIRVGKVDADLDEETIRFVMSKLKPIKTELKGKIQYVKPLITCEVDYLELTKEKELRAPVFKRLRHKQPEKCTWNQLS